MAGRDLRLSDGGDYIDDGAGFFESDSSAGSAVRHQVLGELESWVGDLQAGRIQNGQRGRNASEAEADLERKLFAQRPPQARGGWLDRPDRGYRRARDAKSLSGWR